MIIQRFRKLQYSQNTINTKPNENYIQEHTGFPLHHVLLPIQVYPMFDIDKIHSAT